ncbi:TRAP transporter large permease [Allorhizobium borbori]|uniref:TRAP transporter large permease protein n=1 Tax=Allorhizobium borbori TaxID=485907 RepID=A0A7W6K7L1_9HYPH|nr:TRAP transporter large permease [Allorhizobium borbori]MBB4105736.1 tripartite ATP-independent transporter DctM subunit [Allorhizobium borbori]PZU19504.1 MAG: C4-dicarboxylate ABC transporter permease [Shinella sp.]
MSWPVGSLIFLALMFTGMPIAFSMALVGLVGTMSIIGVQPALSLIGQTFFDNGREYSLSVLPLFLMMGNFVVQSGVADDLYKAAHAWLRHRKGGLAIATILACGGFSSVCGSSLATAATMAKIALPSMRRYRYPDSLSTASIAAGGTLGILIPPSVILVFYGIMTQQDIGKLFLAGIVPGMVGIAFYSLAVVFSVRYMKLDLPTETKLSLRERLVATRGVAGAMLLFAFVMGGIYAGVFTATESAGMGAAGAMLLTILKGRFKLGETFRTLYETAKNTAMMFFILFGALTFTNYVNLSGMTTDLQSALSGFTHPMAIIFVILALFLLLGCLLESLSMITLTVPIFYPVVAGAGFDLIWFGIFVVMVTEISYIHPPLGMNAFVLRSVVKDVSLKTIFTGLIPFVGMDIVRILLLIAFPAMALFLPSHM